jgi:pyruvate,water dikinase
VSPGIGRGRARVVLHPEDLARVEPGEILVVRGADPGWTVVFDRLAGLVAESGGQLSHAAVIARECRLPAIVAVSRATSLIQTGEEIVVDGTAGVIRRVATLTAG